MKIGYARVSTSIQTTIAQTDQLERYGCDIIFTEKKSGKEAKSRTELHRAISTLEEGDSFIVYKLDRLARSMKDLIQLTEKIKNKKADFVCLSENIDTGTAGGELMFHIMGALAQFEASLISERTKEGLKAAKARGREGGRKNKLSAKQVKEAEEHLDRGFSVVKVARLMNVSRNTITRRVISLQKKIS